MDLSPRLYQLFVRPKWFSKYYYCDTLCNNFNFKNKMILDFGCGIGSNSHLFPSSGYIGVDCDQKRIVYAKKKYPNYNFIAVKDTKLPIVDNSIDYIVILSVLHHIPSNVFNGYAKEFTRILKKGGTIIIVEPCKFKNTRLSNWCMLHLDRGKYIRNTKEYRQLFYKPLFKTQILNKYNQLILYKKIFLIASPIKEKFHETM